MIELNNILDYYPPFIAQNAAMHKHIISYDGEVQNPRSSSLLL